MGRTISIGLLALLSAPAIAQMPAGLTTEQAAIVYDQCLARSAVRVSHTPAPDEAIYGLARRDCASTRSALLTGHASTSERAEVLGAIDADKEARFPALTRTIREQRKAREIRFGSPR